MTVNGEIWVTGLGAVTPIGCGADFFPALCQGKNGVSLLTRFDTKDYPTRIGAVVNEPFHMRDPDKPLAIRFALAASGIAWQDAGLSKDQMDPFRVGVILGTSRGIIETLEQRISEFIQKGTWMDQELFFPHYGSAAITREVAAHFGAKGPIETISAACASSTMAIGEAVQWIRRGIADIVITGGTEAPFSPAVFASVCSSKAMSTCNHEPERASRPFDRERDGYVMGEGAGIMILESEEHARARGAHKYGRVAGFAATGDAYHITQPHGEGLARAIRLSLKEADLSPSEIGYINAHGTSTPLNDYWETWAIKEAFGVDAYRIPVSSIKSMTGHLLGASGAVEGIATILAMNEGILPPTMNLEHQDPMCDLDYIPLRSRRKKVEAAMSLSLGFGGHNAAVIFSI